MAFKRIKKAFSRKNRELARKAFIRMMKGGSPITPPKDTK